MKNHLALALVLLSVMLCACQKGKEPGAESKAAAAVRIEELRVGTAGANAVAAQPQTTKAPIVLQIRTSGEGKGAELRARLIDLKSGQQAGLAVQRVAASGASTTELRFEPAAGWTAGRYLIEVKLDGKLVEQRDLDLFDPPASAP